MPKYMVIGAMASELEETIKKLHAVEIKDGDYLSADGNVVLIQSGVGKVNAAAAAQRGIITYSPRYVLNLGISGGLNPSLGVGSTVVCRSTSYHDFKPADILLSVPPFTAEFICDPALVEKAQQVCKKQASTRYYFLGKATSGDMLVEDESYAKELYLKRGADCVDMESGAIAHTCLLNETPFLVVRIISDFADENARKQMETQEASASTLISDLITGITG